MPTVELPHTRGCLVCGRDNPHGLHLDFHVDDAGVVGCTFVPQPHHIGFQGVIHGGLLATVVDEAMVWAATWSGKRFCVCGELNVRYRQVVKVGQTLRIKAKITSSRPRLIVAESSITDDAGTMLVTATAKYVPLSLDENRAFVATLVDEPKTAQTRALLQNAAR